MKLIDINTGSWAMKPESLREMKKIYDAHMAGPKIDYASIKAKVDSFNVEEERGYEINNGIAVINISGVLTKRASFVDRLLFGTTSIDYYQELFLQAMSDKDVDVVILYISSPGGGVSGTPEFAKTIFESRGQKPIITYTDDIMASGAYWVGSAADKIYISGKTVEVGSIGVYMIHMDYSKMDEDMGIKTTEIVAGKYKRLASFNKELSKEGKEYLQSQIDFIYSVFVEDIAKNRNRTSDEVREGMAEGKIFIGEQAIMAGLVDGVSTLKELQVDIEENMLKLVFPGSGGGMGDMKEVSMIESKEIKEKYPEVYSSIMEEGRKMAMDDIEKKILEAKAEGVKEEMERIKGIFDLDNFGNDQITKEMMFDGKSTAGDAAIRYNNAEKALRSEKVNDLEVDSIEPVNQVEPKIDGDDSRKFMEIVAEIQKEEKISKSKAIRKAVADYPKEHKIYLEEMNKRGDKDGV